MKDWAPAGVEGKKGDKGDSGAQGPTGQKGQRGEKGESGAPESYQPSSHMNWKECTWKREDDKDSGVIQASDLQCGTAIYSTKFSQLTITSQQRTLLYVGVTFYR